MNLERPSAVVIVGDGDFLTPVEVIATVLEVGLTFIILWDFVVVIFL